MARFPSFFDRSVKLLDGSDISLNWQTLVAEDERGGAESNLEQK